MSKVVTPEMVRERLEAAFYTLDIPAEIERHTSTRLHAVTRGKQYGGACPFEDCSVDTDGFLVWPLLTPRGRHYYCRGCRRSGDIIRILQDIKGLDFSDACKELGIPNPYLDEGDFNTLSKRLVNKRVQKAEQWQLDELQYLTNVYPRAKMALQRERARAYLAGRGIPFELAEQQGLGYIPALSEVSLVTPELERFRRWCDRIIFPIYTPKGERGYCGRSLFLWEPGMDEDEHKRRIDAYNLQMKEQHGEKARWHQMPRWKYTYQHAFFNLQAVKETSSPVFVEGPFDVLACLASGIDGAVSIGTNSVDVRMLPKNVYHAVMALDIDGAGCLAAKELTKGLRRKGLDVVSCSPTGAKDWSSAYRLSGANGLVPIQGARESLNTSACVAPNSLDTTVKHERVIVEPEPEIGSRCQLCSACRDVDKETPATRERDDLMYCTEHSPRLSTAHEQSQSEVQAMADALPGCTVTFGPIGTLKDRAKELEEEARQNQQKHEEDTRNMRTKQEHADTLKWQEAQQRAEERLAQAMREYREKWFPVADEVA